jgi:hypothetical protein
MGFSGWDKNEGFGVKDMVQSMVWDSSTGLPPSTGTTRMSLLTVAGLFP